MRYEAFFLIAKNLIQKDVEDWHLDQMKRIELWNNVKRQYKEDGTSFEELLQNFENCELGKDKYGNDAVVVSYYDKSRDRTIEHSFVIEEGDTPEAFEAERERWTRATEEQIAQEKKQLDVFEDAFTDLIERVDSAVFDFLSTLGEPNDSYLIDMCLDFAMKYIKAAMPKDEED